ncbi:lysylphosphatidylglycerol synthase transmembrane domain-containing protein [Desulfobacula sp.]|uniref:lysylphosphatidylglycerol synthase transmembrane domain-containing protein n=1 Tax=Desulfobacula sp. TaxID=2593537 RepID=UPI0025C37DFA|nr:lysylphosphatidylglycerol synthase transmembrane domain-containing protein [Desulfobacula sp.]MBC2703250.1 flippase-like domain-containing protein [Desulfobacula sp.]
MHQKYLKILSVLLLFIVVWFVFYNWNDILNVYFELNIYWAFIGFGCYVISYIFRGVRLKLLIGLKIEFFNEALHFSVLHGFFSYLLPLRAGDVSLPVLLKATGKIDLKEGIGALVRLRILDLSMVGIFTAMGAFSGARAISSAVQIIWFISGIALTFSWLILKKIGKIGDYLIKKIFQSKFDITTILKINSKEIFITFFIWMSVYACQYCMIRSIGLDLKLSEVVFLSAIQFPLQMLPVQGLANSGNHEGGWVSSLLLMGFSAQESMKYAIASHGVLIIYVALLGLLAMITGNRKIVSFFKSQS